MHPLECKRDLSFSDKHEKKAARRTSLDNSCLQDKPEVLAKLFSGSTLDSSSHGPSLRRRLSLNNVMAKATTFLADNMVDTRLVKTELDMDCHIGDDGDDDQRDNNSSIFQSSFGELSRMEIKEGEEDESSLLDSDDDSFCEASGCDEADHEYIAKELGASCYLEEGMDPGGDHFSDRELAELEAMEDAEHKSGVNGRANYLDESTNEHSDCDSFCDATDKEPANREYLVRDLGASCFWNSKDDLMDDESPRLSKCVAPISEEGAQ